MTGEAGRTYKSEGVVLKRINFGEADKIITVFSKHYGKIALLAKGIRRLTSKKRGDLELFNQVTFFARKGKGIDIVTETELLDSFSPWKKDLQKIAIAYQICEMVDKLTVEGNEQEEVYVLLVTYLRAITVTEQNGLTILVNSFGINILKDLGFLPKNKVLPQNFNVTAYIEDIIEKELKSKKFAGKVRS